MRERQTSRLRAGRNWQLVVPVLSILSNETGFGHELELWQ
jgi:hypothetical protein